MNGYRIWPFLFVAESLLGQPVVISTGRITGKDLGDVQAWLGIPYAGFWQNAGGHRERYVGAVRESGRPRSFSKAGSSSSSPKTCCKWKGGRSAQQRVVIKRRVAAERPIGN
jgi:hypothetical protein